MVSVRPGLAAIVTVALLAGELTVVWFGVVALAVAWLTIRPASTSAWVTVYVAVHVVLAPGARVVTGQTGAASSAPAGASIALVTATPVRVTLPVLATR